MLFVQIWLLFSVGSAVGGMAFSGGPLRVSLTGVPALFAQIWLLFSAGSAVGGMAFSGGPLRVSLTGVPAFASAGVGAL